MVFSSLTFLLLFLPLLLISYYLVPKKYIHVRNIILLVFSLVFFAWGEPLYIFLLLATLMLAYAVSPSVARKSKPALIFAAAVVVVPLIIFKYTNFIIENINLIPLINLPKTSLIMPIGISFYTFQALTYIIDLYKGTVKLQKNPLYLALYIFLFPQLIAGPIVRYETVENEIENRNENWELFLTGFRRFIFGLAKKVIIANQTGYIATTIMAEEFNQIGSGMLWIAVFAYTIQIYFDFSGYSDMAIGLGKMFGFNFLENFDYPYKSRSVTEFWRRWHISLSTFFRDYIYIPLGGSRVSRSRWIFNIFVVWSLTGLWHGPFWNYIIWGLYYCVMLIIERLFLKKWLDRAHYLVGWAYTFLMTMFGWTIFMNETNNPLHLLSIFGRMFSPGSVEYGVNMRMLGLQSYAPYLLIGFIFAFPVTKFLSEKLKKLDTRLSVVVDIFNVLAYAASIAFIITESFNPFIYFRF